MAVSTPTPPASAGFSDIDAASDPDFYLRYLEAAAADPEVQAMKEESFELLRLGPGLDVLEVGSGLGDDLARMWERSRPGRAVGVDGSRRVVAAARRRQQGRPLELVVGDAQALELADCSFDRYRAERVFQHLGDPEQALAEALRVLRPGGRLAIGDPDWQSLRLGSTDRGLEQILRQRVAGSVAHPQVPFRLAVALLAQEQVLLENRPIQLPLRQPSTFARIVESAGEAFPDDERAAVLAEAERLAAAGQLAGSLTLHWVVASKRRHP